MVRKTRGGQLDRILRMIRKFTFSPTGATVPELMDEFDVSRRTAYRDLEMLGRAGFRFERTAGERDERRLRFPSGQRRQLGTAFTDAELVSLYFCINLLAPLRGTPLRTGLESLLAKIESGFGPAERERFGDLIFTHVARLGPHKDYARHAAAMEAVSRACLDRVKVDLTYRATADETPKTYRFHPYCLAWAGGELYTIGFSELRKEVRTLRIDRIQRIVPTREGFQRPRDFDPEEYLLRGFGMYAEGETEQVRIEFSGKGAVAVREKEWHPTQRIEEKSGGRVLVKMQVQGLTEVARWILYHAPYARAVAPPALRKLVADLAGEAARGHR